MSLCKSGKVTKTLPPPRTALAALRFPHSGPAPWARCDGPSLARSQLSRHPCRSTHSAKPPLGLPKGRQIKIKNQITSRSQADHKQIKNSLAIPCRSSSVTAPSVFPLFAKHYLTNTLDDKPYPSLTSGRVVQCFSPTSIKSSLLSGKVCCARYSGW